jgi:hypothetical protein
MVKLGGKNGQNFCKREHPQEGHKNVFGAKNVVKRKINFFA